MRELTIVKKIKSMGVGVFANQDLAKGQVVVRGRGLYRVKERTVHSFQIDKGTHMQLDKLSRSINHSCDPNTGIRNNDERGYDFVALIDIKAGEEITWNYETAEYEIAWMRKCICGSKKCRGEVRGFKYLDEKAKNSYGEFIADYLKSS